MATRTIAPRPDCSWARLPVLAPDEALRRPLDARPREELRAFDAWLPCPREDPRPLEPWLPCPREDPRPLEPWLPCPREDSRPLEPWLRERLPELRWLEELLPEDPFAVLLAALLVAAAVRAPLDLVRPPPDAVRALFDEPLPALLRPAAEDLVPFRAVDEPLARWLAEAEALRLPEAACFIRAPD